MHFEWKGERDVARNAIITITNINTDIFKVIGLCGDGGGGHFSLKQSHSFKWGKSPRSLNPVGGFFDVDNNRTLTNKED